MSTKVNLIGFHTCRYIEGENCKEEVMKSIPFLCDESREQWLGVGYYFWTDSDYYAHQWGKHGYNNQYCINKFSIEIAEDRLLDLVGNTRHQILFKQFIEELLAKIEIIIGNCHSSSEQKSLNKKLQKVKDGILSTIFYIARKYRLIDYWVIKASDNASYHSSKYRFRKKRREHLIIPTRQQMVVYEEARSCILHEKWVFPKGEE